MSYPHRPVAPVAITKRRSELTGACSDGRPDRAVPLTRRYEAAHLDPSRNVRSISRIAPAIPAFESGFNAIARGTLISTDTGPVAVEDLQPGMRIETRDTGPAPLLWIGMIRHVPSLRSRRLDSGSLVRLGAETMGLGRPMVDLLLGPGARLLDGRRGLLVPVHDLIDGDAVFPVTPPTPVDLFHLCLASHSVILANGIEVETFNPGPAFDLLQDQVLLTIFLRMFPHLRKLSDFGPLCRPRLDDPLIAA